MVRAPGEATRRFGMVLIGLLIVALAVGWIVLMNHPRIQYSSAALYCRPLYAAARNSIDTTKVDGMVPVGGTQGETDNPLRCGDLRRANLLNDSTRT